MFPHALILLVIFPFLFFPLTLGFLFSALKLGEPFKRKHAYITIKISHANTLHTYIELTAYLPSFVMVPYSTYHNFVISIIFSLLFNIIISNI